METSPAIPCSAPKLLLKRAQLLKELVPKLSRLAFLWNRNNASHLAYLDEWRAAVPKVDAQLLFIEVSRQEEFEPAFEKMVQERADALSVTADPFHLSHVAWIIDFVAKHRLPTSIGGRSFAASAHVRLWHIASH